MMDRRTGRQTDKGMDEVGRKAGERGRWKIRKLGMLEEGKIGMSNMAKVGL